MFGSPGGGRDLKSEPPLAVYTRSGRDSRIEARNHKVVAVGGALLREDGLEIRGVNVRLQT